MNSAKAFIGAPIDASIGAPISSRANPFFKRLRMLAGSAQRQRKEGVALLEGVHLADAYLASIETSARAEADAHSAGKPETHRFDMGGISLECCIVSVSALARDEVRAIMARLARVQRDGDASQVVSLDDALFEQISPVVNGGVGLMLLMNVPNMVCVTIGEQVMDDCIVLDGVQDAGNVGSILRSAAASGVRLAFCMPGTASAWSSKVLRAAMGAHFVMDIVETLVPATLAERLGIPVVITDSHGDASIYDWDMRGPQAWVFGNEGAGVSPLWRERATCGLTIPQPGRIESLNVAAAAAVCLFEQSRQRLVADRLVSR